MPFSKQRALSPVPESIPRQKTHIYISLICFTAVLIYFYSYPLNLENWSYVKLIKEQDANPQRMDDSDVYEYDSAARSSSTRPNSVLLQKLFANLSSSLAGTTRISPSKESLPVTESDGLAETLVAASTGEAEVSNTTIYEAGVTSGRERDSAEIVKDTPNESLSTTAAKLETISDVSEKLTPSHREQETTESTTTIKVKIFNDASSTIRPDAMKTLNDATSTIYEQNISRTSGEIPQTTKGEDVETTPEMPITVAGSTPTEHTVVHEGNFSSSEANETLETPGVQNGFLVFSENCRIPDIDPMHPSIRHLVETNPPLDCSEDYKPMSRTKGHVLILDERAILQETRGRNYTCCYKSIFRKDDGLSDNGVGFGKCIEISKKATIRDEFITVECKHRNGTLFYREFHSFIFDKPKVEKRCGKRRKSQYSVLIVGVDAMSRMNMHRQLNRTAGYMLREMGAVEMYGFNKVGDNTFPNLIPLLMGYDERELPSVCWESSNLPLDRCNFMWKRFAAKGYRTLYAEDSPHISSFNYVKEGFLHQPTDYYFRHFILAYEDALGRDKPLNCYLCVGSKSETEAVLHWTEQFASHFSGRPYFAFTWINSLTHDFLNMGSSGDQMYEKFFSTLHRSGALNKTIVIVMGDHGMRWGDIRKTYIGRLEERLPMLLIALPEEFKREHPQFAKVLKENSNRLVTPFDLHATLAHVLDLKEDWRLVKAGKFDDELSSNFTRRALSLFQPVPVNRSCDDAFIEEHWCTCESSLKANINSSRVKRVASFVLDSVNKLLEPVLDKCASLTLDYVSDARLWQPPVEHRGHSADDNIYTVVIHSNPGKAVFEGTVKLSPPKGEGELLGTISRLNLYGNQSSCIDNAVLRKYCYCL